MNSVNLIGRLTDDPELRYLPNTGMAVSQFTLAINRELSKEKKQEMEQQGKQTADFIRIIVFGKTAENCANYLRKGRLSAVDGRIQTRSYEASDGTKRYITEIVANRVEFLEWGSKKENIDTNIEGFHPVDDDDVPF